MYQVEKTGDIEIRVHGKSGNMDLTPNNYDISQLAAILKNVEDLLFPTSKKDRPLVTYNIEEGSVRHIFKTSIQTVIGFSAVLGQVQSANSIDFLDLKTARAFENIQGLARQKNYEFEIKTSLKDTYELVINPATRFDRVENIWVEAELYFYGTIKDAGGKNKANIHIDTPEGYIAIETGEEFLKGQEENLLYKKYGIHAIGLQNIETGEVDTKSLKLKELIDYSPTYDSEYLNGLIQRAKSSWKNIDPDSWLLNLRGGYEA